MDSGPSGKWTMDMGSKVHRPLRSTLVHSGPIRSTVHSVHSDVEAFLNGEGPVLDVRSPAEYLHAHIPGSINLPLFTDEERAQVGTTYKQIGPEAAMDLALRLFGPKMADYLQQAKRHIGKGPVRVYCWRGGLRSRAVGTFLEMLAFPAQVLKGGYKAFRKWALQEINQQRGWKVLGGLSGSGKTEILHELERNGEQILDLEALACHRGSSYGIIPDQPQPSNEHFENLIACHLRRLDSNQPIWIEDESRQIGKCTIPNPIFDGIRNSPLFLIQRPLQERLDHLEALYATLPAAQLLAATERIRRRLGNERTDHIIALGKQGNFRAAVKIVLEYYDKAYSHTLQKRKMPITACEAKSFNHEQWAKSLSVQP